MNHKIVIDADDNAVALKKALYDHIKAKGYDIADLNYSKEKNGANYVEIGYNLALKIQAKEYDRGILLCGTGLGMAIIANKVQGVYAGVCHDVYMAERLIKSNNAQIITMGARVIGIESAKSIIDAWLRSEFTGGPSLEKVQTLYSLEGKSFGNI